MMNRAQRRAYQKKIKNNPAVSICPKCGQKTLFYTTKFYTTPSTSSTVVNCYMCDQTIREGEEVTKLVPPGITLPVTLEVFDKALMFEASKPSEIKEAIVNETNSNNTTSEDQAP